jgi:hypothetical protein
MLGEAEVDGDGDACVVDVVILLSKPTRELIISEISD